MTQSGRIDYDQIARAQALLLNRNRLSPEVLVSAYRTVRTEKPNAYTELFVEALLAHGRNLHGEAQIAIFQEAVDIARRATETDRYLAKVLVKALTRYQQALCEAGRRAEGLQVCREMALVGKRAFDSGVVQSSTFGSWELACRLAEDGNHAEAAALLEAIVHDDGRATWSRDFWVKIPWIAEMEAAGQDASARDALAELIDEDRRRAGQHTGAYAHVIWEQLLMASMDRANGREHEAGLRDLETEAVLTKLAAEGEPKTWGNLLANWAVLISLTGRTGPEPDAPLFSSLSWIPRGQLEYLSRQCDKVLSEVGRVTELAEREPERHLAELVEVQREFTLRSVKYWHIRTWRVPDELRCCFDDGVDLARKLVEVDEPLGRAALARALADRTSMHVAARDYPPALRDFQQARRAAAGDLLA